MSVAHRMSDRLQELLQQRALIQEHLAWLDSEIAAAAGQPSPPEGKASRRESPPSTPANLSPVFTPRPVAAPAPSVDPRSEEEAQLLLEKLAAEEREKKPPSKTGCWLFFGGALAVFSLVAWALLRHFYS